MVDLIKNKPRRPDIGKFRHRVEIYTLVRNSDGAGGFSRADTLLATVWANVRPVETILGGREVNEAAKLDQKTTHVVVIRNRSDVSQGMTLKYDSRDFYVLSVVDKEERGEFLWLKCREGGPE